MWQKNRATISIGFRHKYKYFQHLSWFSLWSRCGWRHYNGMHRKLGIQTLGQKNVGTHLNFRNLSTMIQSRHLRQQINDEPQTTCLSKRENNFQVLFSTWGRLIDMEKQMDMDTFQKLQWYEISHSFWTTTWLNIFLLGNLFTFSA